MKTITTVCVVLLLVIAPMINPQPVSASVLVDEQSSISINVFDLCNGELLQVSGVIHGVVSSKENNDGTIQLRTQYKMHGEAIGLTSGCRYVFNDKFTQVSEQPAGCGSKFVLTRSQKLVSQGAYPNLTLKLTLTVAEDEHCVVTTSRTQTVGCKD